MGPGFWVEFGILGFGFWVCDCEFRIMGSGFWVGFWVLVVGFWVLVFFILGLGLRFKVLGFGFWVVGLQLRVQDQGVMIYLARLHKLHCVLRPAIVKPFRNLVRDLGVGFGFGLL